MTRKTGTRKRDSRRRANEPSGDGKHPASPSPKNQRSTNALTPIMSATISRLAAKQVKRFFFPGVHPFPLPKITTIQIIKIGPEQLIENRQAWVEFAVANWTSTATPVSYVSATVQPAESLEENYYSGNYQFPVPALNPLDDITGALSFLLPRADLGNTLTLNWMYVPDEPGVEFPTPVSLGTATIQFDVGAKFTIGMNSIFIRNTASHHEDTLWVSLNGQMDSQSWADAASLGDHNNTEGRSGIPSKVLPVGPFFMLPGSQDGVSVSSIIANDGHSSDEDDAAKVLDTISKVGAVVATTIFTIIFPAGAVVWAALSAAVDAMQEAIIGWIFADCDTVVYIQSQTASATDLFGYTFDPADQLSEVYPAAWISRVQKKKGEMLWDWLGGGCRDSDYSSGFNITRLRQNDAVRFVDNDGIALTANQVASFAPLVAPGITVTYTLEGPGTYNPMGQYEAPDTIGKQRFAVLRWTAHESTTQGLIDIWSDFAVIILD